MNRLNSRCCTALLVAAAAAFAASCQGGDAPTGLDTLDASLGKAPTAYPADMRATPVGLVAWWRGEEDASDVTGVHDGALVGDAGFEAGQVGRSFAFGGDGEVLVPFKPVLNLKTVTVAAWVRPTDLDGTIDIIFNKEQGLDGEEGHAFLIQYEIGVRGSNLPERGTIPFGNFAFYVRSFGLPNSLSGWADGHASIPLDTWTHVAMTFDGETARALVNGEVTRTVTGLERIMEDNVGPVKIGARSDYVQSLNMKETWEGGIDEVMLFDRGLDPVEVRLIYIRGLIGAMVTDGALNPGQGNALLAKVATTQSKVEQGKSKAALGALGALLNQVEAWTHSGVLSGAQADLLSAAVQGALGDIG